MHWSRSALHQEEGGVTGEKREGLSWSRGEGWWDWSQEWETGSVALVCTLSFPPSQAKSANMDPLGYVPAI